MYVETVLKVGPARELKHFYPDYFGSKWKADIVSIKIFFTCCVGNQVRSVST